MKEVVNPAPLMPKTDTEKSEALLGPLCVAEVMTSDTLTLNPTQSVAEAVALMANQFFRHVLVVDEDERLHGVISDRDVLRALARTTNWNAKTVSEIMTQNPVTITRDIAISVAIREMLTKRINCLPVIGPDGRVCGIVTSTDLLKAYEKVQSLLERNQRAEDALESR
jgi:acetoin utilization protein AcuB